MSALTTLGSTHSGRSSSHSNKTRKKKKDKKIEKEEIKVFLFADGMIIYIENAKKSIHTNTHTTNLLELINYFSEVTGYKINIPKSVLFLYGS